MVSTFNIQIRGVKRLNRFVVNLGPQLNKAIRETGFNFLKDVQKSAKLRAPRFTGQLAQSIHVLPGRTKQEIARLIVESLYGIFQEQGFTPHVVHGSMFTRAGGKIKDWMRAKGIRSDFITVRKSKPFIAPALEANIAKLGAKISNSTNKAIRRSRR